MIQLPFFSALYYAARYTPGVLHDHFLWFNLNSRDFPIDHHYCCPYYFQSWLSIQQVPEEQRKQMAVTMYSMPIMMIVFGISSPAAVILYWFVGGIFSIIQQLITNYIIKPRLQERLLEEFAKNPPKAPRKTPGTRKDVTPKILKLLLINQRKTVTPVSKIENNASTLLAIPREFFLCYFEAYLISHSLDYIYINSKQKSPS